MKAPTPQSLSIFVNDQNGNPPPAASAAERIRLVWADDPSTTATIAWDQTSGSDAVVKYGTVDYGRAESYYENSKTVDRSITYRGMENRFARLSGLLPDTKYYFCPSGRQWCQLRLLVPYRGGYA